MPLINCPECKQQISDTAPTCPHCGFVQHATPIQGSGNISQQTVTIESTSKTWKLVIIMAILVILIGVLLSISNRSSGNLVIGLGVFLFIVAKIGTWWTNR